MPTTTLNLALIGAGQRGTDVYGDYALARPDEVRFVAVAEPHPARRARFAHLHQIPPACQFATWEDLLGSVPDLDAVVIASPDQSHTAPALAALRAGLDVLLEKPMATSLEECSTLVHTAEETGRILQICHVLRYTPFFSKVYEIVQSGRLGDVITVAHRENVAYYHMAHSFVRGNWRNTGQSSPMILAKCCHDLDILYWILGESFTQLSSVGTLRHFRPESAPHPDVPSRCTDGCPVEAQCPFSAIGIYLENRPWGGWRWDRTWPHTVLTNGDLSPAALREAVENGPYGRCVYHCDNDVVDHQVVTMETRSGTSVTLTMHGHSHQEGRTMRYDGTRATLEAAFTHGHSQVTIHDHLTGRTEIIPIPEVTGAHGGGDPALVAAFVKAVHVKSQPLLTDARAALESHLLAFAAEDARLTRRTIDLDTYRAEHGIGAPHDTRS